MWKSTTAAFFFLLAACAEDKEQFKAQTEEAAKATPRQPHSRAAGRRQMPKLRKAWRCGLYHCRTSLKNDRAAMQK